MTPRLEIFCEVRGDGLPVLFIHGTGSNLSRPPHAFTSPLAEHFTVLGYDQRGEGRSGFPPGPWTMADYADDAAALLDAIGWRAAAVVGVSFGGMVAQELALRHPYKVGRLVLAVTSAGGAGGSSSPLHELADASRPTFERLLEIGDRRRDASWRRKHHTFVDAAYGVALAHRRRRATEPDRERGVALQLEARRHHDAFDRLGQINCPCLVVAGKYDDLAPLANSARLVSALPDARLQVLPGGHEVLFEAPERWEEVVRFLRE